MSEQTRSVTAFQIDYLCDKCKTIPLVNVVNDSGLEFKYSCPRCKSEVKLPKLYPYIIYK